MSNVGVVDFEESHYGLLFQLSTLELDPQFYVGSLYSDTYGKAKLPTTKVASCY